MYDIKSDEQMVEIYKDVLGSLSRSTDDYLYVCEVDKKKYWFYGALSERYNVGNSCSLEEWWSIVHPKDVQPLIENLQEIMDGKQTVHNMEYRLIDKQGKVVWISCRGTVQKNSEGKPFAFIGRVSDTIFRYKVDELTGFFNKVKLEEDLKIALESGRKESLLLVGIDNLKSINIKYGRDYGDEVLQNVARVIEDIVKKPYRMYRVDGDCFVIRLGTESHERIKKRFARIQKELEGCCTLSGGAVVYHEIPIRSNDLIHQYSEEALEKAKRDGRNRLAFFSSEDFESKRNLIEMITEMQSSIENNHEGFYLCYQPQVDAKTLELFGVEALLRYKSPSKGNIYPTEFIPVLEQTGLIKKVGIWVFKTALKQCFEWRKSLPNLHVSVNISYSELIEEGMAGQMLKALRESSVPGSAVTVEITESIQLQNFPFLNEIFRSLRKAGIEISVDDFGTGYSSLSYLKHLAIDEIKIDRCFVTGIQDSTYNFKLVSNISELAGNVKIRTCCEGVESVEELEILKKLKLQLYQGYLFSKPVLPEEFEERFINSQDKDPFGKYK